MVAAGVGAIAEAVKGKLQTGVEFQGSWTVGLLFTVSPTSKSWPNRSTVRV